MKEQHLNKEDLGTLTASEFMAKLIAMKGDMSGYAYMVSQPVCLSNFTLQPDMDHIFARKTPYPYPIKLGEGEFRKLSILELGAPELDIAKASFRARLEFCKSSTQIERLNLGNHPYWEPFHYQY